MDFTLKKYTELLMALKGEGYEFLPFCEFVSAGGKTVCLRHDVDKKPGNSLATARIEAQMGIRASYYFRAVPRSWDEEIIREIASMGHEIGYHYESLTTCEGNVDAAYMDFCRNLAELRKLAEVSTICMHGSPRSAYDSRDIWKKYDYRTIGLVAEPYLDTDWSKTFYLTDTGRRWDGYKVSVRDKIPHWQDEWNRQGLVFHHTDDIISRVKDIPNRIMITTHPQRWCDSPVSWCKEYLLQSVKNIVKMQLLRHKRKEYES